MLTCSLFTCVYRQCFVPFFSVIRCLWCPRLNGHSAKCQSCSVLKLSALPPAHVLCTAEGPWRKTLVLYEAVKAVEGVEGVKLSASSWGVCLLSAMGEVHVYFLCCV